MRRNDVIQQAESIKANVNTATTMLTDLQAPAVKTLYPVWKEGEAISVGDRRYYPPTDMLYKCSQAHTTQADWTPDVATSLWTPLDVEHTGTLEDPIPAVSGMEYVKGKYYSEDGTIYLMNREGMVDGEAVVLHFLPSQLVGQYFEAVE